MKVFIIGARGYVGSHVARRLRADGHSVSGLARSLEAAAALEAEGILAVPGDLTGLAPVRAATLEADATILCALANYEDDEIMIKSLLASLSGTGKAFVLTSGSGVLSLPSPEGQWHEQSFAEDDPFVPAPALIARVRAEQAVLSTPGLRGCVIRPPLIWGNGGSRQVPAIFESVARTGAACYVGRGLNCYSHLHIEDLSRLFSLVVEKGTAGSVYHALAGEENFRSLAQAVARVKGVEARSVTAEEARGIWGERAERFFMMCSRTRSAKTQQALGWRPTRFDLVEDIVKGSYKAAFG